MQMQVLDKFSIHVSQKASKATDNGSNPLNIIGKVKNFEVYLLVNVIFMFHDAIDYL